MGERMYTVRSELEEKKTHNEYMKENKLFSYKMYTHYSAWSEKKVVL